MRAKAIKKVSTKTRNSKKPGCTATAGENMPDIGRWNAIDKLAENYLSASPYAYVLNNPINMFDPNGLLSMMALTQAMWDQTPDGTNSYWQNNNLEDSDSGGKPGGVGSSFVYVGGTAGLQAGYGIGSTLDMNGNFNSYYGSVTNGVLNYMYWTNGMPASGNAIQGLDAHKGSLNLNSNNRINGINLTPTNPFDSMTQQGFNWIQSHPREITSIAGAIEGSSRLAGWGLDNWNASSNISKSRIFAETISTRLPASAQALGKFSTVLKWGGRAVGAIGIANSLYQGYQGNISTTRAAVDTIMGIVGFFGPWGAAASLVYFGGMAVYEHYYNDDKSAF